ncbi:D-alanyl-D-alanine carboxypeptidase/D-alanyl-D-alanine-endopeptidase [Brachybacterium sp. EF45031]|uniref:D-alanyl-D-alanine carboxypeptidase/D-alanyl-D-alanine endopeptidase n=1 Tax=Brachybacterium sillae TaxID=2810536 RepID=UPI00217E4B25|nr:D-alanyl-D-alanine carboxypeptidase/D-alanyl-D-alanine-endopeptidase [Brachybacterium sillae]MCS6712592.1 D-alanyl-D-alanine carboxypeptidase/D-alanyl-D-alanine-endopeptidase [Brachybacterium sillae]
MRSKRIWRATAIALALAVPTAFYAVGDVTDAFPGVLTLEREQQDPTGPPAQGEDAERVDAAPLAPPAPGVPDPAVGEDLVQRLDAHAAAPVVQGRLAYSVIDVETGAVLAQRDAATARTPASTVKVLVATAALRELGPDSTLPTRAVLSGDTLTLVGGGDVTLAAADLDLLAERTAPLVREAGLAQVRLQVDDTLFTGNGVNPAWGANGPAGGWVAPVHALAVDLGRLDAEQYGRKSSDPALDAGRVFARSLQGQGVTVTGDVARGRAPQEGPSAEISSAPVRDLVAQTLKPSENTLSEALARLVAVERGLPADAEGSARAVQESVTEYARQQAIPTEGLRLVDGSGLAVTNAIAPQTLAGLLAASAGGEDPALRGMLSALPVGGLDGTLAERFGDSAVRPARGLVHGKTGYLGGTASLAGVTTLPSGRAVAFSVVVYGFDGSRAAEARAAVDAIAAEIGEDG